MREPDEATRRPPQADADVSVVKQLLGARDQNRKQWTLAALLIFAVCMACAPAAEPPGDKQAWIVDLGGIHDTKEMYLAAALQGIVNRDKPRLFYRVHDVLGGG